MVVVVVVRTWSLICGFVHTYQQHAMNWVASRQPRHPFSALALCLCTGPYQLELSQTNQRLCTIAGTSTPQELQHL